jgi:hypothetical protein
MLSNSAHEETNSALKNNGTGVRPTQGLAVSCKVVNNQSSMLSKKVEAAVNKEQNGTKLWVDDPKHNKFSTLGEGLLQKEKLHKQYHAKNFLG